MKQPILFSLLLLTAFFVFPQCPEGQILFTSQAEIDQFKIDYPDCTKVASINIEGTDISDLSGLSNLTSIDQSLFIRNNTILTSLSGLDNLTSYGLGLAPYEQFLEIYNNPELLDISALGNLSTHAGSEINIMNNPKLQSLHGLESQNSELYTLQIYGNGELTDLAGLEAIQIIESVYLTSNANLSSIKGLDNVTDLVSIEVSDNNKLTDLSILDDVNMAGAISFYNNALIQQLPKFNLVDLSSGYSIVINNNSLLSTCESNFVCEVIQKSKEDTYVYIDIFGNAPGCNTVSEVEMACPLPTCPDGPVIFTSQAQIDQFKIDYPNCTEFAEGLEINGADIVDLSPLVTIEIVRPNPLNRKAIYIHDNPVLTSLSGLENITTQSRDGTIDIVNNALLINLDGLIGLDPLQEEIYITDNPSLQNLNGLSNLAEVYVFYLKNNDAIIDMSGLENLTHSELLITIVENDALQSLNGLQALLHAERISIRGNVNLTDISSFDSNLKSDYIYKLEIIENTNLQLCNTSFMCQFLNNVAANVTIIITNNAEGCGSVSEILDSCNPQDCPSTPLTFTSQEQIDQFIIDYPNCTYLSGLTVSGADIINLNGLSNIQIIEETIKISNCPQLINLGGLENVVLLGSRNGVLNITIKDNNLLQDLHGLANADFENLGVNDANLTIENNDNLTSDGGLNGLRGVFNNVLIKNNSSLITLGSLVRMTHIEVLTVQNNGIKNMIGGQLPSICELNILDNPSLIVIPLYESFSDPFLKVSYLKIENNPELADISAMYPYDCSGPESYGFIIRNNPKLAVCNSYFVCDIIKNYLDVAVDTVVENNLSCNSIADLQLQCEPPDNNVCNEYIELFLDTPVYYDYDTATSSGIIPPCENNGGGDVNDVWFRFNSENSTRITLSAPEFFAAAMYSGTCDNLTPVDNACGTHVIHNINLQPNTNYFIQLWRVYFPTSRLGTETSYQLEIVAEETLGIDAYDLQNLTFSPNPTSGSIKLSGILIHNLVKTEIYSILGKKILESSATEFNLDGFNSGVYMAKMFFNDGSTIIKKIVKN